MSSLGSPNPFFIAGKKAYEIERSLRFNRSDEAYLETTLGNSNLNKWTLSVWVKKAVNGEHQAILASGDSSVYTMVNFGNSDRIKFTNYPGSNAGVYITTRKFRDPSAWYHIVAIWDSGNSTAGDRIRIYVNGVRETAFDQSDNPNQNQNSVINGNTQGGSDWGNGKHRVGRFSNYTDYTGCYYAEFNFVDGQAYDPSYFAETDVITGQWKPKKYTGSYGTNGFYLNFSDNSGATATTMGKDSSGNGNNFTLNNLATSDVVKDTPTNNFCTWNPLENFDNVALSEGNLRANGVAGYDMIKGNMGVSSGKWYFEIEADAIYANTWSGGIHELYPNPNYPQAYWYANYYTAADYGHVYAVMDNNKRCTNGSQTTFTSDITAGDIVGFRLDLDNNELSISVNGTDKGKVYDIQGGVTYTPAQQGYATSSKAVLNCGQDSTFAGAVSSGGNADANGIGDFKYPVPSGYKAICSANLPDPTILLPNKHFDTLLWSGNATTSDRSITGLNFQPDWAWTKTRNHSYHHALFDAVRGPTNRLNSDQDYIENFTSGGNLASFDAPTSGNNNGGITWDYGTGNEWWNLSGKNYLSWNWNAGDTDGKTYTVTVVSDSGNKYRFDGYGTSAATLDLAEGGTYIFDQSDSSNAGHPLRFSTTSNGTHGGGSEYTTGVTTAGTPGSSGAYTQIVVAASAPALYYYCTNHSGMGGAINTNSTLGSSNFDGTIQVTSKVNATAGFSILTYPGTGSAGTIGHGLGVAPQAIITKRKSGGTEDWKVYHQNITGGYFLKLNATQVQTSNSDVYPNTAPTSTVYSLGNHASVNASGSTYVAYVFSEVAGYSKFGEYRGNGDSENGSFVFTNHRPAWIMFKNINTTTWWFIYDVKRETFNVMNTPLAANEDDQEYSDSHYEIDILSNGFKIRGQQPEINKSGDTIVYFSFAESPFKNSRAR